MLMEVRRKKKENGFPLVESSVCVLLLSRFRREPVSRKSVLPHAYSSRVGEHNKI